PTRPWPSSCRSGAGTSRKASLPSRRSANRSSKGAEMAAVSTEAMVARHDEIGVEPARPVLFWGAVGAAFAALIVYVFAAWFISGDAKAVTTGPDKLQTATKVWAWFFQGVMLVALVWTIAYAVRKCRQEGRLAFDAIFIIA